MTQNDEEQQSRENAARQRISEISTLFTEMRSVMSRWLKDAGPVADASTKQMMTKISELQSAHLLVIRAEEAFHDKFGNGNIEEGIDYEAARHDIGRALDRLRATVETRYLSEGTDDGAS